MLKLLDRYIAKKFFSTLILVFSIITLLIILIHATENMGHFRAHHLSLKTIFRYYCVLLPFMANFLAPIIVFATTIWVTTRLSKRSELIAMLSGGVSFPRLAAPYLLIGSLLTGLNFYLVGWLLAGTNKERIKFEMAYLAPEFAQKSDALYLQVGQNQYLYINKYNPYQSTGYGVTLDHIENQQLIERIHAKKMVWNHEKGSWKFILWNRCSLFAENEALSKGYEMEAMVELDPQDFEINPMLKEGLTLTELTHHILRLQTKGDDAVRFFVAEKHIRYMAPFAIIILIMLGFLVSVPKPRHGMGKQITLGFILACLYITLFLSAKTTAEIQSEHPLLNIWIPNILFTALCGAFYRFAPK